MLKQVITILKLNLIIFMTVFLKQFNDETEVDNYFNELVSKVNNTNENELKNLIISY